MTGSANWQEVSVGTDACNKILHLCWCHVLCQSVLPLIFWAWIWVAREAHDPNVNVLHWASVFVGGGWVRKTPNCWMVFQFTEWVFIRSVKTLQFLMGSFCCQRCIFSNRHQKRVFVIQSVQGNSWNPQQLSPQCSEKFQSIHSSFLPSC